MNNRVSEYIKNEKLILKAHIKAWKDVKINTKKDGTTYKNIGKWFEGASVERRNLALDRVYVIVSTSYPIYRRDIIVIKDGCSLTAEEMNKKIANRISELNDNLLVLEAEEKDFDNKLNVYNDLIEKARQLRNNSFCSNILRNLLFVEGDKIS